MLHKKTVAKTYTNSSHWIYVECLYIWVADFCVKKGIGLKIAFVSFLANNDTMIKITNIWILVVCTMLGEK